MRTKSIVAALLVSHLAATSASAGGVNLRWARCYGDGGVQNRTFACNTNAGTNLLVVSFVLDADLSQVSGNEFDLDVVSAGGELPAWWAFRNAGTCRQTSLTFNTTANPNDLVCVDWTNGMAAGGIGFYNIGASGPNTAHIRGAMAVPASTLQDLVANQEYFSFNLVINNAKTIGTGSCSGCAEAACVTLNSINVTTPVLANNVLLTNPAYGVNSNLVAWQNGPAGGVCAVVDTPGFVVSTSVLGRGTLSRTPDRLLYTSGTPLTLAAQPLPGDRFVAWSGDTTSTNSTLELTVLRDLTYFANFDRDPAAAPTISSVVDVPNDQGGSVLASWNRSPIDDAAYPGVVCCYRLERTLAPDSGSSWVAASGSITATHAASYTKVLPSSADSVLGDPAVRRYRVVAVATDGMAVWVSNEVNGYSVDNLAPPAPASVSGVMASGTATMFWPAVSAPDFSQYAIYRGPEPSPPADLAHRIGTTTATNYTDSPGHFAYYSVTGVDRHGNESPATPFVTLNETDVPGRQVPRTLTVGSPFPSPMHTSMSMAIGLPNAIPVTADVLDPQGRLVRRLAAGEQPAGWLDVKWDARDAAGRRSAAGIYFIRVLTPNGAHLRRQVLLP